MSQHPLEHKANSESQQMLRIYGFYRIILAALLLLLFLVQATTTVENAYRPDLFLFATGAYFVASVLTHIHAGLRQLELSKLELLLYFFLVDIAAMTLIAHASGGLSLGLSLIMTLTVASGAILFRDRLALLVAALASIATLLNTGYLIRLGVLDNNALVSAGMLGAVFFATIFLVRILVRRIESSQQLADQRSRELAYSEYLNQLIVRRMQTGVLVTDRQYHIHSANEAAVAMLGLDASDNSVPEPLLNCMQQWQHKPHVRTRPFRMQEAGALLQSEFMSLAEEEEGKVLVFLEDTGRARQQAQQIKLASLGRLTASIAHEIRNPLGAISHAAQLMHESETISDEDRRLCDMVTSHSQRMNRIIENVLQLSRRKASEPEKFELGQWLRDFIASSTQSWDNAEIELLGDAEPLSVSFDPVQLDQVLSNLCSNGLRHSQQATGRSRIQIHAFINPVDGLPVIDVIDFGPGVAEENLDRLFEPFYTSEKSGTGLGLFIAKELCEANHSRLDYLRSRSQASCFRITFAHPMKKLMSSA